MDGNEILKEGCCLVCGTTSSTGLHYGAITCYPCRAFFRRIPERKRPPVCKRSGRCLVASTVTKHCPGCRFQVCLRVGMQLCQVLNEEQRQERFAASLQRKRAALDQDDEEESDDEVREDLATEDPVRDDHVSKVKDNSIQDLGLALVPKEANVLLASRDGHNLFGSISSMPLQNSRLSTSAVQRNLCSPPPLMLNDGLTSLNLNSSTRPPLSLNLRTALTQQNKQFKLACSRGRNPPTSKLARRDASAQHFVSQNGLSSCLSTSKPHPTFAGVEQNQVITAMPSSSYQPISYNSRLHKRNEAWRGGPPPLLANSRFHLEASPTRVPVQEGADAPLQKTKVWPTNTNGSLLNSTTGCKDMRDKEDTSAFSAPATFAQMTTKESSTNVILPKSRHPEMQLNDPMPWIPHHAHKQFSKAMMICHMLSYMYFATIEYDRVESLQLISF